VQGLILLVVIVHFTISAKVTHYSVSNEQRPHQSDDLCNHPACYCAPHPESGMQQVMCDCNEFAPEIPKVSKFIEYLKIDSSYLFYS
jgi:hypothetical protein